MQRNAWSGWIAFAGWLMVIIGSIDAVEGLIAIIRGKYYVVASQQIIVFDIKTWGWITLLWGILVALVGVGLLSASSWARWTAIVVASLSFIVQLGLHWQHALRVVGAVRPGPDGRCAVRPDRALG